MDPSHAEPGTAPLFNDKVRPWNGNVKWLEWVAWGALFQCVDLSRSGALPSKNLIQKVGIVSFLH